MFFNPERLRAALVVSALGSFASAGDIVGRVGSTGFSTGCHLHFMRLVDGRPVDPLGVR